MLRKRYYIAVGVVAGVKKYTVKFKRTKPGDFKCNNRCCVYRGECDYWILPNGDRTADICITYPRISGNVKTRHYYSPSVVKEI